MGGKGDGDSVGGALVGTTCLSVGRGEVTLGVFSREPCVIVGAGARLQAGMKISRESIREAGIRYMVRRRIIASH